MDSQPSQTQNQQPGQPEAETLQPRTADGTSSSSSLPPANAEKKLKVPGKHSFRPSHRATLIGLAAVVLIMAINAVVLGFVLRNQAKNEDIFNKGQVSINTDDLNKLGINRSIIGDSGVESNVAPDAKFKGTVAVAGDTTISGNLFLNGKFRGPNATISQLQAGKTVFNDLNVNGNGTITTLNLRKDLVVTGQSTFQGVVDMNNLLTVSNNVNIKGNISIGGSLNVNTFSVRNLRVSGHLSSSGSSPFSGAGGGVGSNGTVSVSGNDTTGTISVNIGVGGGNGTLVNIAFRTQYRSTPQVVFSPVGEGGSFYVTNQTIGGFSIGHNGALSPGGYRFNYIVME